MEVVGEMKHRKFGTHTQAVAGVIEALLMVALVSIVISMIQLIYIPQVMEQKEAEHMDLVSNQFSTLKSMIDLQGMTRSSAPISSMITLGSRDLPYFITAKAYGGIFVNENATYRIEVTGGLDPTLVLPLFPSGVVFPTGTIPLTSIEYQADNSYFTDQSYVLEGGDIILKQPDGTPVTRADPSISAKLIAPLYEKLNIRFNVPIFIAMRAKNNTYGEGNCYIRTNYSMNTTCTGRIDKSPPGQYIKIYTKYPTAWNESLNNTLGFFSINPNKNITYKIVSNQPTSYIEIRPGTKDIIFELNIIYIYVQIGQGWIQ